MNIDSNGIAWVTTEEKQIFGIVNAFKVLDNDDLEYTGKSVCDLLDDHAEIEQDYEAEKNIIRFTEENGESYFLAISADNVELIETSHLKAA